MSKGWSRVLIGVGIVVAAVIIVPTQFTAVNIDEQDEIEQGEEFDAAEYVQANWDEISGTVEADAVELATVLNAIQVDEDGSVAKDDLVSVTEQYGLITPGEAHVYSIRATGVVVSVDTDSSVGTMQLEVDGYEGPVQVNVYVGPRLPSADTSVRDAAGIEFGEFTDQTEFGQVASEINAKILEDVLSPLDLEAMVGSRVAVVGALTIRTFNLISIDLSEINIVPVTLEDG